MDWRREGRKAERREMLRLFLISPKNIFLPLWTTSALDFSLATAQVGIVLKKFLEKVEEEIICICISGGL